MNSTAVGVRAAPDDHLAPLTAFDRALEREAHNLMGRPDLLWQQLHNRLQWEEASSRASSRPNCAEDRRPVPPRGFG